MPMEISHRGLGSLWVSLGSLVNAFDSTRPGHPHSPSPPNEKPSLDFQNG